MGGGSDTVYIENSDESLQDILGPVTVTNPPAYSTLVIDDSGDSTSRIAALTSGSLTGLSPAPIYFQQSDLNALDIYGGSGGTEISVESTPFNANRCQHVPRFGVGQRLRLC